jgi:F-type H+-transporting ATPase subunit alpha
MKKVAGTLKLVYSQFRELQSFAQFGSDLDADTKARLAKGERIVQILKQDKNSPVPVEKQVVIIYAVINGYLDRVKVEDVARYEKELYSYLDVKGLELLESIRKTGKLEDESVQMLKDLLDGFGKEFLA